MHMVQQCSQKNKQKFVDDVISLRVNFVDNVKHPTL